jgi:hypothetical protein
MNGDFAAAAEAHQRQLAEQEEETREQKVAYLQRNAARRMFQADLLYGWSTWQEQWEEAARQKRMLAAASARLARPQLAAAVAHWVGDWRAAEHERALASADKSTRELMATAAAERSSLAAELAEVRLELENLKLTGNSEVSRLEEQLKADAASAEEDHVRQMEEQLEAEKEKRVAHLQQQAARRIANAGIASGFTTWQEQWEEKARQKRMLAAAGSRLARPALAAAVAHWRDDWQEAVLLAEMESQSAAKAALIDEARLRREELEGGKEALLRQLERERAEAAAREQGLEASVERLLAELQSANEASAARGNDLQAQMSLALETAEQAYERKMAEQLEAEKEKRVAGLEQQAARRIANADIAFGFSTWQEQWAEAARQKRMLAAAGARLARPALAAAVAHWLVLWREEEEERRLQAAAREKAEIMTSVSSEKAALQAQLDAMAAQLAVAGQQQASLQGDVESRIAAAEAAFAKQVEERLEAEKEKRIAHLQQQAARRIANAGIASGFTTWQGQWEEQARQKRMLAAAGARLARPALAAAVAGWVADWREAEAERQAAEVAAVRTALLEVSGATNTQLTSDVEALKAELAEALAAALRQKEGLVGTAADAAAAAEALHQKQMEAQAEAEGEKRIAHLQQLAARRIACRDIAMGFSAWQYQWEEQAREKRMLAAAGARLARPALAAAVAHWVGDWHAAARERAAAEAARARSELVAAASADKGGLQVMLMEAQAALKAALADSAEVRATMEAALANQALSGEQMFQKQMAEAAEAEKEKRVAHLQKQAMRRIANAGIASGFTTWQEQWEEQARQKRMLAAAGARLSRPALAAAVAHWRTDWQVAEAERVAEEQRQAKGEYMAMSDAARVHLDEELRRVRAEASKYSLDRVAIDEERRNFNSKYEDLQASRHTWEMERQATMAVLDGERRNIAEAEERPRLEHVKQLRDIERKKKAETAEVEARLQELLSQQRESFEEEKARMAAERNSWSSDSEAQRKGFEDARKAEREERAALMLQLEQAQGEAALRGDEAARGQVTIAELRAKLESMKAAKPPSEPPSTQSSRPTTRPKSPNLSSDERIKRRSKEKVVEKVVENKNTTTSLKGLVVDTSPDALPIPEQLRLALSKNAARVIDLFREWDEDKDGKVSKKEFRKAMPALGFDIPVKEIDALFDANDPDRSGSMEFKELKAMLKPSRGPATVKTAVNTAMTVNSAVSAFKKKGAGGAGGAGAGSSSLGPAAAPNDAAAVMKMLSKKKS